MLLAKQPRFCWPKVLYCVSLNKPRITKDFGWTSYFSTKYLGKAKMLNKKLPVRRRQIDVRYVKKNVYVLEGSYDKRSTAVLNKYFKIHAMYR